jgi:hypothetical protein
VPIAAVSAMAMTRATRARVPKRVLFRVSAVA